MGRKILQMLCVLCPWSLRRRLLIRFFGYKIHPTARIGFSWIFPEHLEMGPNSRIGHFNVAIHLHEIGMKESSTIGRGNWITGFPKGGAVHFQHLPDRKPCLEIGAHTAITKNHHIDCTEIIKIGSFTTIAGYGSQFLTHSIDIVESRQDAAPIIIGDYCFIGTNVVALGGSILPDRCVVGAKSLLNRGYQDECFLYGGVPAKPIKKLPQNARYFTRQSGRVS